MSAAPVLSLIHFEMPVYLGLLALLPLLVLFSFRSLAGLGRVRHALVAALRCLVAAAFIIALAGPELRRTTDDQTVVFLLDHSRSVPVEQQQAAFQFVQRAAEAMRPGKDRLALVTFDGVPSIEQSARDRLLIDTPGASGKPDRTNIEAALRMATALFLPDAARRIVVLSDGNENSGDAMRQTGQAADAKIPIDVLPLSYAHDSEVVFERLWVPPTATLDETVRLNLVLRTQRRVSGRVLLYHQDRPVDLDPSSDELSLPVVLQPGTNRTTISLPLAVPGVHRFWAVFKPDDLSEDSIATNNEGRAFTVVGGPQKVLLIATSEPTSGTLDGESARILAETLRAQGITCDLRRTGSPPLDLISLLDYSLVILSNVPAHLLAADEIAALAAYVRELGGGLVAVGGDSAFSVGGYYQTPLEEVLPVETNPQKLHLLSTAMVFVIDKSGSMMGEKLELAKRAAVASVELLSPMDQVGVVAFDGLPDWVVRITRCTDKGGIIRRIHGIGVGGGTVMYPGIEQAAIGLSGVEADARHVIVLTDGQSAPGDFEGLTRKMAAAGITVSTIAIGDGADSTLLAKIAQLGRGRFYETQDAQSIPQIFARETVLAGRSGMSDKSFQPVLKRTAGDTPAAGLDAQRIPQLGGYVITSAKPLAHVPIVRVTDEGEDPVLAHWQVGLGKSVALTSGFWPRWGARWVEWPGFGRLWAQICRWAARSVDAGGLRVATSVEGGEVHLRILAPEEGEGAGDPLVFASQVLDPEHRARPLQIQRTGLGQYEAVFSAADTGSYVVRLSYESADGSKRVSGTMHTGVSMAYSPEYREMRSNEAVLSEMARLTDGEVLAAGQPDRVFSPGRIRPVRLRRPVWDGFVWFALILFLLDVAARRLAIDPVLVLARLRAGLQALGRRPARGQGEAALQSLRGARARARDRMAAADNRPAVAPGESAREAAFRAGAEASGRGGDALQKDFGQALGADRADSPVPTASKPVTDAAEEGDYTSRLLDAKRRARQRRQDDQR